jgi:hypothetical protein
MSDEQPATPTVPQSVEVRLAALEHALTGILGMLESIETRVVANTQRHDVSEATITAQSESLTRAFDNIGSLQSWVTQNLNSLRTPAVKAAEEPASGDLSGDLSAANAAPGASSNDDPGEAAALSAAIAAAPEPGGDPTSKKKEPTLDDFKDIFLAKNLSVEKPIIFTHIPKCAGNTINAALKHLAEASDSQKLTVSGATSKFGLQGLFDNILAGNELSLSQFRFVGGHLPFSNFREHAKSFHFIASVRNPVERAISDVLSQPSFQTSPELAYDDILKTTRSEPPHTEYLIDNIQVRMFANSPDLGNRCTTNMLYEALENIEKYYSIVFSSQNTAATRELFCKLLGVKSFTLNDMNVNASKPHNVPDDVVDALREFNAYDVELLTRLQVLSDADAETYEDLKLAAPTLGTDNSIPNPSPTVSIDDPGVPKNWRTAAPEIILSINKSPEVRDSWIATSTSAES